MICRVIADLFPLLLVFRFLQQSEKIQRRPLDPFAKKELLFPRELIDFRYQPEEHVKGLLDYRQFIGHFSIFKRASRADASAGSAVVCSDSPPARRRRRTVTVCPFNGESAYGLRTTRKPRMKFELVGSFPARLADRQYQASLLQPPPRSTR